jgi:hypothetical protein
MIKSLKDQMSYSQVYPNSTLRPDWDLLEEIITVYRQTEVQKVTFEWVKGHQDEQTSDYDLSPNAIFNIHSDALATATTQATGLTLVPHSPLLLTTQCLLTINGSTITGKYCSNLRLLAAEPAFFDYLARKHHWDPSVIDTIDWDSFCMAAQTYSSTEVHLLKLVHDKLPLHRQVYRHQAWTSEQCNYCSSQDTMDHLQTSICSPVLAAFRGDICKKVRQYLQKRQSPKEIERRFLLTLQTWFDPVQASIPHNSPPREQLNIGLRLLTQGFLARHWRQFPFECIQHQGLD